MTFRTLLIIKAVVCLVFGLILLLMPSELVALLGSQLSDGGVFTAHEYGAALIGTFLLTWFAKNVKAADARGAILLDLMIYDAIGVIITLLVVLPGIFNALGWGIVVIYLFFTLGSAYLFFTEKPLQQAGMQSAA